MKVTWSPPPPKDMEVEGGLLGKKVVSRNVRGQERVMGGSIRSKYMIYLYKNGIKKPTVVSINANKNIKSKNQA